MRRSTSYTWRFSLTSASLLALGIFSTAIAVAEAQTTTPTSTTPSTATTSTTTTTANSGSETATDATSTTTTPPPDATTNTVTTAAPFTPEEQRRAINLAANISNQLDATVARLNTIADRLDRRLNQINAGGGDATAAREQYNAAQAALARAATTLSNIDTEVYQMATAPNPAAPWPAVKAKYRTAQQQLRDAHAALTAAVTEATNI